MHADSRSPDHVQADFLTCHAGFFIEVEHDFHVVGQKTHRHDNHIADSLIFQVPQVIADVRFQPRNVRWTAATLIDQLPAVVADSDRFAHQTGRFGQLLDVIAAV